MKYNENNINHKWLVNTLRNIVKTENGYQLQPVYKLENGEIVETEENRNNLTNNEETKFCDLCIHNNLHICLLRKQLDNNKNFYFTAQNKCDAYEPIQALNIIRSENEMIDFIEKTENFFSSPESYEEYYGFEPKWDEGTGEVLESAREYYSRGGKFTNIPNKYPCVIYSAYGDLDNESYNESKLLWIYIGADDDQGCEYCNINSDTCNIFKDTMTNEWYMDIETSQWDDYDDGFVHQKEYINYCPYCGRKLGE